MSIPFTGVNSGPRLKAYIQSRWGRDKGGMSALADKAGVRRQTLYEWFRPASTTEPSLSTLTDLAKVLKVRRVDLVAAMDGVTAPEQQETPRPEWTEGFEDRVADRVLDRLLSEGSGLDPVVDRAAVRLGLLRSSPDEDAPEGASKRRGSARTTRRRTA